MGVRNGSRDLLLKFWDPLHILGMVRDRNVKLARRFITICTNETNAKLGQRGSERGHVT